jgi:hypothetical protein
MELLTREVFRESVMSRDKHGCVVCGKPAKDAHHILERRLWPDGGYYVDNGVSVCGPCHLKAEQTKITCEDLRSFAGIQKTILPPHLYKDQQYDKWGNPLLPNGTRLKGELFHDENVQKVLDPVMHLFTNLVKYPRTWHFPWSPGVGKDDRIISDLRVFEGQRVVVTAKLDGENTTLYNNNIHARSIDYAPHESRNWVKSLHGKVAHDIPDGWRVCGENLYAKHSIHYKNLSSWFQVFSMWDNNNTCLSWDDTLEWAALLGLQTVQVLYDGVWNEESLRQLHKPTLNGDPCEGYVARLSREFHYKEFQKCCGKYVRENHVTSHAHWIHNAVEPNGTIAQ